MLRLGLGHRVQVRVWVRGRGRGRVCWKAAAYDRGDLKVGVLEVVGAVCLVEELERAG